MSLDRFPFEPSFNLKLEQLDGQATESQPKVISSIFITYNTLQKICEKERVLAWSLPLAALQRKIGETACFVLPDKSVIDDVFQYTLYDYRQYQFDTPAPKQERFPSTIVVNWLQQEGRPKDESEDTSSQTSEGESKDDDSQKIPPGPMKEKDWDYVFQANKILSCSYVDPLTRQILRAPHAAFRLKTSNEDDAEPDLPQDDEKAKIPVWTLSKDPSRTYIHETNTELETSAMISGHSKKSLEVGLSGAYKMINAEGKYGRTTENAYKNRSDYGKKESTMLTIYEIPIVELNLDRGNSRISDACRQALLKLRHERQFDDLMDFFAKYGTMYPKKVVLGGRLIANRKFWEETTAETNSRQQSAKNDASLSVGIDPFSVKGSYSDEHGTETEHKEDVKTNQKNISWTAIGGNPGYVSNPEKWLTTVRDYKHWKIIQNTEVVAIQKFIGSLPGYDDIPGLFQEILDGGLYNPCSLHLGPRPALPGQRKPAEDGLDIAPLGAGIDTFTMGPAARKKSALAESMLRYTTSRTEARGGCSWQILDTADAVKLEIAFTMRSITNTSANRSAIPRHLYSLSLEQQTIFIVLQWSSDLIETGINLGTRNATQVVHEYTKLGQLAPETCSAVVQAAKSLKWDSGTTKVVGKEVLKESMRSLAASTQYSSPAAFRVEYWQSYLENRSKALEGTKSKEGQEGSEKGQEGLEKGQEGLLASIQTAIIAMPEEDMDQQCSTMLPFEVTADAQKLLEGTNKASFVAGLGQQFLESYTEKASLTAVWRLHLPTSNKEEFYALRILLQKYFLGPRSVNEVCNFLGDPEKSFQAIEPTPDVKVSIFGYRDEFTKKLIDVNDEHPSMARYYLNQDVLLRNKNRVTITMRPWQGLHVKKTPPVGPKEKTSPVGPPEEIPPVALVPPVAPEEFFVLNIRKAERLLLLLHLYSKDPESHVVSDKLKHFGKTLDKVLDPSSLDKGKLTPSSKVLLIQLPLTGSRQAGSSALLSFFQERKQEGSGSEEVSDYPNVSTPGKRVLVDNSTRAPSSRTLQISPNR
ncbi:hypothetical protein MMC22_004635 [Lobaria immixta]|nr:hypothetical protein [Lobaria immixta]